MPFSAEDWAAIALTLRLAATTTVLLLVLCTPIAWWLATTRSRWRGPVGAIVALPLARPGFITAAILSFAHTVGEFGVVLMLGGNIPGHTRVVSVQIYDHVEAMEYGQAHALALGMVVFAFVVLLALHWLQPKSAQTAGAGL